MQDAKKELANQKAKEAREQLAKAKTEEERNQQLAKISKIDSLIKDIEATQTKLNDDPQFKQIINNPGKVISYEEDDDDDDWGALTEDLTTN